MPQDAVGRPGGQPKGLRLPFAHVAARNRWQCASGAGSAVEWFLWSRGNLGFSIATFNLRNNLPSAVPWLSILCVC
jgi:hypothetical protein